MSRFKTFVVGVITLLMIGCAAQRPDANLWAEDIGVYLDKAPTVEFSELQKLSVNYREAGLYKESGSNLMMIVMLQAEARKIGADAIMNIQIKSKQIAWHNANKVWNASATAIKYK